MRQAVKSFIVLWVLMVLGSFLYPATAQVDSTFRFYFYDQRYSLFQQLPDTPGEIIMLGNSITNGGNWQELFNNPKVKNRGISGDNTFGILNRIHEVTASAPEKIFILIGINDLSKETPVEVILNNYRLIVEKILAASPQTRIYLQSVLPTNNEFDHFPRAQNKDHLIRQVNAGIEQIAMDFNQTFIDLYPHFLDEQGKLSSAYTNDGLHLMGEGYVLWANLLRPYLEDNPTDYHSQPVNNSGLYYERRKQIHESVVVPPNAIVMLGNSITEHGLWNELLPGKTIVNRGIGGDNIAGMIHRLPHMLEKKPSTLVVMGGVNNILFHDATPEYIEQYMEELIIRVMELSPDTRIILQSILPVNEIVANDKEVLKNRHTIITRSNERLSRLAERYDVTWVDLHALFTDAFGRLDRSLTTDGIHLNGEGYKLWAGKLLMILDE
ncbi:MAG: GDSL-type esterase/lipase family protein [Bacteroidota bacterium]